MVEPAALLLPRLRQRIEPPAWGVGRPQWHDVEETSLAHHLRRVRAPGGDLDTAAAFDPARSPWDLTIADGLDGGRWAIVLRFHHAITDEVGGIALADFDHARHPDRSAAAPRCHPRPPAGPASRGDSTRVPQRTPLWERPGARPPPWSARPPPSPPR
jgi:hypothetical protein